MMLITELITIMYRQASKTFHFHLFHDEAQIPRGDEMGYQYNPFVMSLESSHFIFIQNITLVVD
jgi:hypothetical protein